MSVIDAIRAGAVLCYSGTVNGRAEWWLEPNGTRVSSIDAARARKALSLRPQLDGNTWRYTSSALAPAAPSEDHAQ